MAAGCVIAARLTEDAGTRVLLLEAGSATLPDAVAYPPAWPSLAASEAGWGDTTVVQQASGAPVALPRGKGLGGSSAINAMVFARGFSHPRSRCAPGCGNTYARHARRTVEVGRQAHREGIRVQLCDLGMRPETTSSPPKTEPDFITG
ncbi:GMC family oxidoreductase N-terminal domain-containing protein [Streptomyces sp. NPDC002519]